MLNLVVSKLATRLLSINSENVMTRVVKELFLTKFKVLPFTVRSIQETGPSYQVHSDVPLCTA